MPPVLLDYESVANGKACGCNRAGRKFQDLMDPPQQLADPPGFEVLVKAEHLEIAVKVNSVDRYTHPECVNAGTWQKEQALAALEGLAANEPDQSG